MLDERPVGVSSARGEVREEDESWEEGDFVAEQDDLVPKSNVEVRFFIVFVLWFILSPRGVMKKILADFADVLRAKCYTHLCGMLDVYQYNDRKKVDSRSEFVFCSFVQSFVFVLKTHTWTNRFYLSTQAWLKYFLEELPAIAFQGNKKSKSNGGGATLLQLLKNYARNKYQNVYYRRHRWISERR